MGITDYGHRGVVNVFLGAPLLSATARGTARTSSNPQYDELVKDFIAQSDIDQQKQRREGRSRSCCSTRRRSSSRTSTTSSRASRRASPGVETTGMGHIQLDPCGPERVRADGPAERSTAIARFIAKRIALGLVTLFILSVIIFAMSARPARGRRPAGPRAVRRCARGGGAQRGARHRPAARHAVPRLDRRRPHRRPRRVARVPATGRRGDRAGAQELRQAGAAGVRHRRAAGDPRRRLRGAARGQARATGSSRWAGCRRPRSRSSSGRSC